MRLLIGVSIRLNLSILFRGVQLSKSTWNKNGITETEIPSIKRPRRLSDIDLLNWLLSNSIRVGDCYNHHSPHPTSGYGMLRLRGSLWQAHRFIRCTLDGLPKDHPQIVRRSCKNRACINPDHLVWGSPSESRIDDVLAGKNVKITPIVRQEIKAHWNNWGNSKTEFDRKYATMYNVSIGSIRKARLS